MSAIDFVSNPVMKAFLAGSLSGTCSTLLFQPLDLVKTRVQSHMGEGRMSIARVITNVVSQDSLAGLWRGLVPSMAKTVPGVGLYFSSMHYMKTTFCEGRPSHLQSIMIGCTARTVAGSIMIPFTVIKTRFESRSYSYSSTFQALRQIIRTEGFRGLTLGLGPTLIRDVPFSGLYLMFYEHLKTITPEDLKISHGSSVHFTCGVLAGFLASLVTQPADVIKTQLQLQQHGTNTQSKVAAVVRNIYQTRGISGFTSGLVPRSLRRTLMAALAWTVYERMIRSIGLK